MDNRQNKSIAIEVPIYAGSSSGGRSRPPARIRGKGDAQGIEDLDIVSRPCLDIVAGFGLARWQPSTAGNADDVEEIGELECKIIEYVRVVARPGQQHHHLP